MTVDLIREKKLRDPSLRDAKELLSKNQYKGFIVNPDRMLRFIGGLCVLANDKLKKIVLSKDHKSMISCHPSMTKMYQNLKKKIFLVV